MKISAFIWTGIFFTAIATELHVIGVVDEQVIGVDMCSWLVLFAYLSTH